jgi:predicted AAA+ superfamily ATPase
MNPDILADYNPWWRTGSLPDRYASTVPRNVLPRALGLLSEARVLQILGIRRCGKTVLLHQMIGRLLDSGVDPRAIVYFSADDVLLADPRTVVQDVLGFHRERVRGCAEGPTHVFMDEVHAVPGWSLLLKGYVDRGEPYTWTASSSAGVLLHRGSTESLAGRAWALRLYPFSLAEYAAFVGSPEAGLVASAAAVWRDGNPTSARELAVRLGELDQDSLGSMAELLALTRRYLRDGGFPEALSLRPEQRARYFSDAVVDRLVLLDVPAIAEIRNPSMMAALIRRLVATGPSLLNVSGIARDLETTKVTLTDYLSVMDAAMVGFILDRYAGNVIGRQRGMKKSVPLDPGLTVAIGRWDMDGPSAARNEGLLAEIAVHSWLLRQDPAVDVAHWREDDREVDFVVSTPGRVLPIEVKWRDEARMRRLSGLDAFRRRFGGSEALVVTRETFEVRKDELCLPVWMLG